MSTDPEVQSGAMSTDSGPEVVGIIGSNEHRPRARTGRYMPSGVSGTLAYFIIGNKKLINICFIYVSTINGLYNMMYRMY